MTLHVVQPEAATLHAAILYVGRLKADGGFLTRGALAEANPKTLSLAAPHPAFNLALDDIGRPDALARTRMTGWRFIVLSQGQAIATLEFAATSRRDAGQFSRITDGRMAASSARAIARAERSTQARLRRYALGMLRVSALGANALWLRDLDEVGRRDLFSPVEPVPAGITAERWQSLAQWMLKLKRLSHLRRPQN
jgi:hypothetical protein